MHSSTATTTTTSSPSLPSASRSSHHHPSPSPPGFNPKSTSRSLNASFFLFGLLNNSLYVVILTAALELLPKGVPTGLVSLANIAPALVAKAVWPYLLKGRVRYTKRVSSCASLSFVGMMIISLFPSLHLRLLGISLASFSSGLGELTFLQLSTRYSPKPSSSSSKLDLTNFAGDGVGWFASGTGAAGLVGAAAWWIVRPLGVKLGLAILSLLPGLMVGAYLFLLPSPEALLGGGGPGRGSQAAYMALSTRDDDHDREEEEDEEGEEEEEETPRTPPPPGLSSSEMGGGSSSSSRRDLRGTRNGKDLSPDQDETLEELDVESVQESIMELAASPIAPSIPGRAEEEGEQGRRYRQARGEIVRGGAVLAVRISFSEKMQLLKPMLWPYILPLVTVYFAEYTINQGVAPTLIYELPTRSQHPLLSLVIKKLSDYYPLYQLVYQTFVFISRSSVSILKLPAIPKEYLWFPAILQTSILLLLITESLQAWFRASIASPLVLVLICLEGLAGGAAYVSVFYQIGIEREHPNLAAHQDPEEDPETNLEKLDLLSTRLAQQHEFRIGSVGFGDSLGILAASLVSMPLQVGLCDHAYRKGRELCKAV